MRRTSYLLATVAALSLALAPGLAAARAGGGSSSGSRGSMTWSAPPSTRTAPTSAQPMQRSMTPNTPSPGMAAATPGVGSGLGMSRGSAFTSGLMGGLIGAGIGGLLFGHGFFGSGMMGGVGFLGFLLQIGLIVLAVTLLVRWFRRRQQQPAMAGGPNMFARSAELNAAPMGGFGGDGEGTPTVARALIEDGVLTTWLLDSRSARQLGLRSTGHASRGTSGPPSPSPTNLYLSAGKLTPAELMADIKLGIYVNELIGMGVNGVTGDYSRGAAGFMIRDGALAEPVAEITIAGNLVDMFAQLVPANDLRFRRGTDSPTVRVDGMTIAGA